MKVKEIIIVEGKDDTAKLKQAMDVDTIETNGSAINKDTLEQIVHAKDKRGVIVFTDPDYPGQRIRQIIDQHVPGCKHAFLSKEEAKAKGTQHRSLGIEHASLQVLRNALSQVYQLSETQKSDITQSDLMNHGLIGGMGAKDKRNKLGMKLRIGHINGKQLLKRLQMFEITKEEFENVMESINQEEHA
ncbi:ribonuclease M5 [Gracilibacillus boraciitolerans JCM 21714]|uniref:Ribonuclease M5 n=1 Tax=Gracilibacillus boraciitolerans JCM 21714 TaxID=1298598 RepID=W4VLT9_9BACI|nr:ribonuclease M5 [Gracilibacillus boraciitolerans]GAE94172.1 ribonuclease M5 [Gracilibacillus boraciitolerans JCM 21714]